MALFACHLRVQTGQWIPRLRVVKLADADCLPVDIIMTLQTIRPEAALVFVLMTGSACLRDPEKGVIQVFDFYRRPLGGRDFFRVMALIATQASMFSFELVASPIMIERPDVPLHQRKIGAVVF